MKAFEERIKVESLWWSRMAELRRSCCEELEPPSIKSEASAHLNLRSPPLYHINRWFHAAFKRAMCKTPHWKSIAVHNFRKSLLYTFIRRFYPKRLTVHSGYMFFCQYMCSLGIEPTTFALLTQCSNHWATGINICLVEGHITYLLESMKVFEL